LSGGPAGSITQPVLSTFPGFIAPCLPTRAKHPPSGGLWLHEIKHDGFRIIAREDGRRFRLYSRRGNDFTRRFPMKPWSYFMHQTLADALEAMRL
jgi:ATP-dependent DNA ligase